MRFLLDESVDARLAGSLLRLGHEVATVGAEHPSAISDAMVLDIAVAERRVLITNDRDFGELVFLKGLPHAGVIYLRLRTRVLADVEARFIEVLARFEDSLDEFIVVTDHMVRIRSRET